MSRQTHPVICPQCGLQAMTSYDCRIKEKTIHCMDCGYVFAEFQLHNSTSSDEKISYRISEDGKLIHKIIEKKGYGLYFIKYKDSNINEFIAYERPVNESDVDWFREKINSPEVDKDKCYLTSWNDELNKLEYIDGSDPLTWRIQA